MIVTLILGLLAVTLVVGVAGLATYLEGSAQRALVVRRAQVAAAPSTPGGGLGAAERWLARTRLGRHVAERLELAGIELTVGQAVLTGLAIVASTSALAGMVSTAFAWVAGAAICAALVAYVDRCRAHRLEEFVAQLPDLARVLSNAASAGLAVTAGLEIAARELPGPAAGMVGRLVDELRVGQPLETALGRMRERVDSREVGVLVTTLVVQQRVGGNLVAALRDMATVLDARKDLRREIRTMLSGVTFTAFVVPALGVTAVLLLSGIRPGLLDQLTGTGGGRALLLLSGSFMVIGHLLIRRLTRIDT